MTTWGLGPGHINAEKDASPWAGYYGPVKYRGLFWPLHHLAGNGDF